MKLSQLQKEQLLNEVTFSASRGGGPGGQNVNKVSTKVELRFDVNDSETLTDTQKQRLLSKLKNRITTSDELVLTSSVERTQWKNKEKVTQKFFELVEQALTPPKKRIKTKPTRASKAKRLENKKKHGQKKQLRKPPDR
ncbi:MAG: alternative ribosome rescue aminoacyl-tRNA hydrolase ArfB [Tangfeifania sp.]